MKIQAAGARLELSLSEEEALRMIEMLSKGVLKSRIAGSAWFAEGLVVENRDGEQAAGRITIRVEKE